MKMEGNKVSAPLVHETEAEAIYFRKVGKRLIVGLQLEWICGGGPLVIPTATGHCV